VISLLLDVIILPFLNTYQRRQLFVNGYRIPNLKNSSKRYTYRSNICDAEKWDNYIF